MIPSLHAFKQAVYFQATLLFPAFFKKRFFARLHKGVNSSAQVHLLPEKELLVMYLLLPENNVAVDVGANHGIYSYFFKSITKSSRVIGFEPLPKLYKKLQRWLPDVDFFNVAVSDKKETTVIHIPVIAQRVFESRAKLDLLPEHQQTGSKEITIQTDSLDRLLEGLALQRLDIIKIDIEGHELQAIAGATQSIQRFKPWLLVEIEGRHHNGSITAAVKSICELGFSAWFFNFQRGELRPFSEHDVTTMQNPQDQNSFRYTNNILFAPLAKENEIERVNASLRKFLKNQ